MGLAVYQFTVDRCDYVFNRRLSWSIMISIKETSHAKALNKISGTDPVSESWTSCLIFEICGGAHTYCCSMCQAPKEEMNVMKIPRLVGNVLTPRLLFYSEQWLNQIHVCESTWQKITNSPIRIKKCKCVMSMWDMEGERDRRNVHDVNNNTNGLIRKE